MVSSPVARFVTYNVFLSVLKSLNPHKHILHSVPSP